MALHYLNYECCEYHMSLVKRQAALALGHHSSVMQEVQQHTCRVPARQQMFSSSRMYKLLLSLKQSTLRPRCATVDPVNPYRVCETGTEHAD